MKKKMLTDNEINEKVMMMHQFEPYSFSENEEYMNEKQRNHFQLILNTWKEELMKDNDRMMSNLKQGQNLLAADMNDKASEQENLNFELKAHDRERKLLHKIENALDRIYDKSYGYCIRCGDPIGIKRLEARPVAEYCIECQKMYEIEKKQIIH